MSPSAPGRFYESVSIEPGETPGRFRILLDGKPVRTPAKRAFGVGGRALAQAIAEEWAAQGARIDLAAMPMTRLAMSAADHVAPRMAEVRAEALAFAKADLLCHRADRPERLVVLQQQAWQPYLDWAAEALGARLNVGTGIAPIAQPAEAVAALSRALEALDAERLLVVHGLTHHFGSLILALAVVRGHADARAALEASRLDERFQAEVWGRDEEAEQRRARIAEEVAALARFLALLP